MSTPNDTPAAKALPPSLDPPLGELSDAAVIAFQRLAQAEDIVAYDQKLAKFALQQATRKISQPYSGGWDFLSPRPPWEQELFDEVQTMRPIRDLALSEIYVGESNPLGAFRADLKLLHIHALRLSVQHAALINQHRQGMVDAALARYTSALDYEAFALAARDFICLRSTVEIGLEYLGGSEFTFALGRHTEQFDPLIQPSPARWLPFGEVNPNAARADGMETGDASVEDVWHLCRAHPLLMLLPQVHLLAGQAAMVLAPEDKSDNLASIGERFLEHIRGAVSGELTRLLSFNSIQASSSRGHAFIMPSYLDQAVRLLQEHAPSKTARAKTLAITAHYCHQENYPVDTQKVLGLVFGAAAISLAIGSYLVATAATGGAAGALGFAVLAAMVEVAALALEAAYLFETYKLDQIASAEAMLQTLEPKLASFEKDTEYGFDLAMFAFGCLMLMPAVTEIGHAARALKGPAKAAQKGAELSADGLSAGSEAAARGLEPPPVRLDGGVPDAPAPSSFLPPQSADPALQVPAKPQTTASKPQAPKATPKTGPLPGEALREARAAREAQRANARQLAQGLQDAPLANAIAKTDEGIEALLQAAEDRNVQDLLDEADMRFGDALSSAAPSSWLSDNLGLLDDALVRPGPAEPFFPRTVAFVGEDIDTLYSGQIWRWVQRTRRGLGRTMSETSQYYRHLIDDLGIARRVDLRRLRGYLDSLRSNSRLHSYWQSKGWARQVDVLDPDTGQLVKVWEYRVDDTGNWYPRRMIDFGHVVDVVVYDQAVFLVESEIRAMMHAGEIAMDEARLAEIDHILRKLFMDNPLNYIPELSSLNRSNGGTVGLSYRDQVTFRAAFDQMMRNKVFGNALAGELNPWEVMEELLGRLVQEIPESHLLRQWYDEVSNFTPPDTPLSGGFWPVIDDTSLPQPRIEPSVEPSLEPVVEPSALPTQPKPPEGED